MTISGRPLTADRWIIAILALGAVCGAWMRFVSLNPWPFIVLGVLLLIVSFVLPRDSYSGVSGVVYQKGSEMQLPERWDENAITLGMERYRGNSSLLRRYVDGIVGRFVDGQNTQTIEVRTKFLESFNRYAEVRRESFKWQRVMQKRATLEEDLHDVQAEIALQKAQNELDGTKVDQELLALQKEAKRLEVEIAIATSKKTIAEIQKTDPPPSPPPPGPTAAEKREQQKSALQARERVVRAEIEQTKADPALDDELRQRKLNALYEKLTEIHDALIALL